MTAHSVLRPSYSLRGWQGFRFCRAFSMTLPDGTPAFLREIANEGGEAWLAPPDDST
jgi:hypothetical protein